VGKHSPLARTRDNCEAPLSPPAFGKWNPGGPKLVGAGEKILVLVRGSRKLRGLWKQYATDIALLRARRLSQQPLRTLEQLRIFPEFRETWKHLNFHLKLGKFRLTPPEASASHKPAAPFANRRDLRRQC